MEGPTDRREILVAQRRGRGVGWISDAGLVQDPPEVLGVGRVVALVRVGRPLVPDRAEEDHAGDLAEQLQEGDHQADSADHVESRDEPHLYR